MKVSIQSSVSLITLVALTACAPKPIEPEKAYDKYGNVVMIVSPDGSVAPAAVSGGSGSGSGNQNQNTNQNQNANTNQNSNANQNQNGKS